jgi:alkylated DNA repair dioxygenase AlkB
MPQGEPQTRAVRVIQGKGLLDIEDGVFEYWPGFLDQKEASLTFAALQSKIHWHTPRVFVYGRWIDSPRQSAWYGDREAVYRYSGTINEPIPWLPELKNLGERLNDFCKSEFNSVLANHYRSGSDSMGWHSDDEKELGPEPVIASISLGDERRFLLRHRRRKELQTHEITLENGSLLLMRGESQRAWRHSIPKTRRAVAPRINLTYRHIMPANGSIDAD